MSDTKPQAEQLASLLGERLQGVWDALAGRVDELYDMDRLWGPGGKAWDLELKWRRGGKTLCALYAREGVFHKVLFSEFTKPSFRFSRLKFFGFHEGLAAGAPLRPPSRIDLFLSRLRELGAQAGRS